MAPLGSKMCIILVITILMLSGVSSQGTRKDEGPYEVIFHNVSSCIKEKPWFRTNLTGQGHKLSGTVVSSRELKNVKFRIRLYYLGEGPKVRLYEVSKQECRNPLIRLVLITLGIRFNHEKCIMPPASYKLNDLDMDMIVHTVAPSMWYGPMQLRWEVVTAATAIMCTDFYIDFFAPKEKTQ